MAVLDVSQLRRLEAYIAPELLHHLSTDLRGLPVFLSNSSGLRYVIPLSPQPHMPKVVNFPGNESGQVLIGVNYAGELVHVPWTKLGHLLVAGKTGSGKSVFLRLLAFQAIAISEHVDALPQDHSSPLRTDEKRLAMAAVHAVKMVTPQQLEAVPPDELQQMLLEVDGQFKSLTDLLQLRYLLHSGAPRQITGEGNVFT